MDNRSDPSQLPLFSQNRFSQQEYGQNSGSITGNIAETTAADQSYFMAPPPLSLPKGGGAIRGIGEKFTANLVTGTGSMTVPIATSPSRSGFGPQLSLSYDSGAGNGIFGMGWNLSLPSITRKTDKGLPRYGDDLESDVFILSGAEDLVPVLTAAGNREVLTSADGQYRIYRYRPRIEGLFARIERWMKVDSGETHWRSISKDNVTTLYGKTEESRIAELGQPNHVFSWFICESYDDRGNAVRYDYKPENSDGIDLAQAHEQNRTSEQRSVNRYLKRIYYSNATPRQPDENLSLRKDWLFEVVFDYGEHNLNNPQPNDAGRWTVRNDPFSSYRAGFEVRTYHLCQRVLMFHHIPDLPNGVPGYEGLVRSTDFTYGYEQNPTDDRNSIYSFLQSVTQTGYQKNTNTGYLTKSLPPLEFSYSEARINETVRTVDLASLENLPQGLDETRYQWVDLDGEGLSGILAKQGGGWFYKRNLSPINIVRENDQEHLEAKFSPLERVASQPSNGFAQDAQFLDLAGDGQPDYVTLRGSVPGFYERTADEDWKTFTAFKSLPVLDWDNPNLKFVDLDGDSRPDILITEDNCFVWHPSLAEDGFGAAERVSQPWDEEKGPRVVFADRTQSIYLADMSGDGLTDIVRIRNGEVCYWANLGYGRFGAKVTMDHAPWFDAPELFEQRRIRLIDIDGSGTTDILYLSREGVQVYFNQSGNGWSEKRVLKNFPAIDSEVSVTAIDLLGNGTACLVWSSALPHHAQRSMRYIDLMGGQKPHLLIKTVNNMGAETIVRYAPSTRFYLQDRLAGTPWITKLPFPVQVVERVETRDYISGNRFVTRYAYHHGYFDGEEREFRGFGLVEQWDTEEYDLLQPGGSTNGGTNIDEALFVPPVLAKTWFHTGALLLDAELPAGLTLAEAREAARSLKGSILRQEIYALDGSDRQEHPYSVSERRYEIRLIQGRQSNRHAVFYAHDRETLDYYYERNPDDPRITHAITLEVDEFGNPLKQVAIAYSRTAPAYPEQEKSLITYTENRVTNKSNETSWYRIGIPIETRTYELTGYTPENDRFQRADFVQPDPEHPGKWIHRFESEIPYEEQPTSGRQRRLVEWGQWRYRSNHQANTLDPTPLLLGEIESLALPCESLKLAFTPGLLTQVYGSKITAADLEALLLEGKYRQQEGGWWITSGRQAFDPARFYLATQNKDPFGGIYTTVYDVYGLLVEQTQDALPLPQTNVIQVRNDYRVLQPWEMTDPNGNRSQVAFDALGMVVGTAVMGKSAETNGDNLIGFVADLDQTTIVNHIDNPLANPQEILANATTRSVYDLERYRRTRQFLPDGWETGQPIAVYTLARETHTADLAPGTQSKIQHRLLYSDGFGRSIQTKGQAESGLALVRMPDGTLKRDADGKLILEPANPRWVGTGRTIFNNKGKPVKQYEPFFSATHRYETEADLAEWGVTSILHYDPIGRVIRTDLPNGTFSKVEFDAWQQTTWDENDTVLQSDWYADRGRPNPTAPEPGNPETRAAWLAAKHANTPTIAHLDTLGRTFLTVADNGIAVDGTAQKYETRIELDIEGNARSITDAIGRKVMLADSDLLGHSIRQRSLDAGDRWLLNNVAGKPICTWDSRDRTFRTRYDLLQRPTHLFVQVGTDNLRLLERWVYGERHSDPARNLKGQLYQHYDSAGVVTNERYDFKGNLLQRSRQFGKTYRTRFDWIALRDLVDLEAIATAAVLHLEAEQFTVLTRYDALNRAIALTTPHQNGNQNGIRPNIIQPIYNEANLLEKVDVWLRQTTIPTGLLNPATATLHAVTNIDYNAKGQRILIEYGNQVKTHYSYDQKTFRLTRLLTLRPQFGETETQSVQDLRYTFDPVGNVIHIEDQADIQNIIYFRNQRVEPSARYEYDPLYRLLQATGREHLGQTGGALNPPQQPDADDLPRMNLLHPGDGNAMGNYTERYEYDAIGNLLKMIHQAIGGGWTRRYAYNEPSLIEAGKTSNRLSRTSLPGDLPGSLGASYEYDAHGNMTRMPHLPLMQWDEYDQLQAIAKQVVNNGGTPEITYYVYDASGQRVRKVTDRPAAAGTTPTRLKERFYLGGFEIYREYENDGSTPKLERETLPIMDNQRRIAWIDTKTVDTAENNFENAALNVSLIRYQHDNHLGSACLELDESGNIISYEEYYPYGSTSYQAGRSMTEAALKRYRYTGKERDEETGLYYHKARYYASWLGRWTAADPLGIADGLNVFAYVRNNPICLNDPSGTDGKEPIQITNPQASDPQPQFPQPNVPSPHEDGRQRALPPPGQGAEVRADLRLPDVGLTGRTRFGLVLGRPLPEDSSRRRFDLSGDFRLSFPSPVSFLAIQGEVTATGSAPADAVGSPLPDPQRALSGFTGQLTLRGDLQGLPGLEGHFRIRSTRTDPEGATHLTLDAYGGVLFPQITLHGEGTALGDSLHLSGRFLGVGPGVGWGSWQFDRRTGFDLSGHYIGLQFGPFGLGSLDPRPPVPTSPDDPVPRFPETQSSRTTGVVDTFSPGTSVGYTRFRVNPSNGTYLGFSAGWAWNASIVHNDLSRPSAFPFDLPGVGTILQDKLNYRPSAAEDTPVGHYWGVNLFGSF